MAHPRGPMDFQLFEKKNVFPSKKKKKEEQDLAWMYPRDRSVNETLIVLLEPE